MVISTDNSRQPPDPMTPHPPAARISTQPPLHNFSSFPILGKWGARRVLRCVNVNRDGDATGSTDPISRSEDPAPTSELIEARTAEEPREERGGHVRTVRLRSEDHVRRERDRFSVRLTREEIDEDFYALTGSRARRRPKKRPRIVQKQLDVLFPGLWLSEITVDTYKVPE